MEPSNHKLPWTDQEEQWLIENYQKLGPTKCSKFLNRTISSCKNQALKLKIAKSNKIQEKLKPGKRFNKLTLIKSIIGTREGYNGIFWECECDCGGFKTVYQQDLRCGKVGTCGCFNHGLTKTNLYKLWRGIKGRCLNKNASDYHRYGEIGIKFYEPWVDDPIAFINYIKSTIGERPKGKTLDRINNSGNYEPGNLRWATLSEQVRNSKTAKINENLVKEIKNKYKNGTMQIDLAIEYNLSKTQVWRIINGRSWGDVKC